MVILNINIQSPYYQVGGFPYSVSVNHIFMEMDVQSLCVNL